MVSFNNYGKLPEAMVDVLVHLGPWLSNLTKICGPFLPREKKKQVKHWKPPGNDEKNKKLKKPRVFPSKKNRAARIFSQWFLSSFSHGNCPSDRAMTIFFSDPPETSSFHGQGFAC